MTPSEGDPHIYAVVHQPSTFTARSAFPPLIEQLGATALYYSVAWEQLQKRSWTLGLWLRRAGIRYYGSSWSALVPWLDERRFVRAIGPGRNVVHFLWGEFASPRRAGGFRKKGAVIVGTFHCSARRQASVLGPSFDLQCFDRLSVVSKTQIPFFVARGYPADRITVLPLGVDTEHFRPMPRPVADTSRPLRGILVGHTERDHEFMATVMRSLPSNVLTLDVCTHSEYHKLYAGIPAVRILPRISDDALLELYQQADLMVMPMLDCTANDAMLECMACGTPVMTNRVGGVPEYVDASCNFVFEGKDAGAWVTRLTGLAERRRELQDRRDRVRAWAERFSWQRVAEQYRSFYRAALVSVTERGAAA